MAKTQLGEKAVDQFDCVFEMSGFSYFHFERNEKPDMPIDSNQRDFTKYIAHSAIADRWLMIPR